MDGSCRWITKQQKFINWIDASEKTPKIYWLTGPPATGKSTLTSFVVEYLQHRFLGKSCQYHFFLSNHQKRTGAYCLRSIALQLALLNEPFRMALFALNNETGVLFGSQKLNFIWEKIFEGIVFKANFPTPLFWVVDALDEADLPQVLINLFMKIRSVTPIKVFMTSRMTKELAIIASSNSGSIDHEPLSINDTLADIRAYVHTFVRSALPYGSHFQEGIADQVLEKASGSFLWVKLALDTLKDNWHTREDVRKALHEVPEGMESLYAKMITHVMDQTQRLRTMALRMLTWTACASRPLHLDELKIALSSEFDGFVSLEDTIIQICGHFVRIDKSKVFLIHSTARQFLLDHTEERSPFIDRRQAHEHVALRCLEYLSDGKWRAIFMRAAEVAFNPGQARKNRLASFEDDYPFLSYAVQNWAFHVGNSSSESDKLLPTLSIFLERYCLSWIHAVALSGNLRTLTHAAQDLKAYVRKSGRENSFSMASSKNVGDEASEFLWLWAVDIIRIVGKFGANLAENPSSIYRMIPLFCPKGSKMRETYGRGRDNALSVAGISSFDWDDCLARLNVGEDETASKVLCTGSYFVTLIGSSGTLVVWHAESCEEARRMRHGEWVTMMTSNKSGTLIATAGIQTFRVWEIATGKQVHCLPKYSQARTMAIAFGTVDSELLIGRDDFSVSCYDLLSLEEKWDFVAEELDDVDHSCPRLMAFSPDIDKVAIACRGRPVLVWDITMREPQQPRRCIRTKDRDIDLGDVYNCPEIVVWQPEGTSLLILYQDTTVVDWRILEDEQDEYDHLGAREMIISQDGSLLLTSDHNGSLSIWTFPRLNLLYRLHYDETVRDLAFSPNGQRFYDTRGSLCNVWEPDALVRPDELEREDSSSNSEMSILSDPIFSRDDNSRSQITALACDADDKFYCCGKDDGTINIHEMSEGKKLRKVYSHAATVSIISLAWSRSGKYIVSGDDSGRVVAKRLESKEPGKWAVYPIFDFRLSEPVDQFIFNPSEKLILVSTRSGDRVWNLRSKEELCRRRWPSQNGRRWISHPLEDTVLLWIDPTEVQRYDWQTLTCLEKEPKSPKPGTSTSTTAEQRAPASTERPALPQHPTRPSEAPESVYWISRTKNRRYIICETLPDTGHSGATSARGIRLEVLSTSEIGSKHEEKVARRSLDQLSKRVARLIGSYQDRVAFLDHQYWLCTWEIDTDFSTFKRHFFLPKDWLSPSTLQLAALTLHGTFLCPKNGEVGIVRSGVKI
jgi:WD40 repeat protein